MTLPLYSPHAHARVLMGQNWSKSAELLARRLVETESWGRLVADSASAGESGALMPLMAGL